MKARRGCESRSASVDFALLQPSACSLCKNSSYAIDSKKPIKWNAVKQLQLPISALAVVFSSFSRKVTQPLQMKGPAMKRPKVIDLDDEESPVRSLATSAGATFSLEVHPPLVIKAEAPRLDSVLGYPVRKRRPLSSALTSGCRSKKATRATYEEEGVKAGAESLEKEKNVTDATAVVSATLRQEDEFASHGLKVVIREY